MQTTQTVPRPSANWLNLLTRLLLSAFTAGVSLLLAAAMALVGMRALFAGRALPGVTSMGINLAGKDHAAIEGVLSSSLTYPGTGTVVLHDSNRLWTTTPSQLGVAIDVSGMADRALAVGRQGSVIERVGEQIDAWVEGSTIPAGVVFDQRQAAAYLRKLAAQIDQPQIEATIGVQGTEVNVRSGQIGRNLDVAATIEVLTPSISRLYDADLPLVIRESAPQVLDASKQAAIARDILAQPLTLTADGASPWSFDSATLAGMLRFNRVTDGAGSRYEVGLDPQSLAAFLEPLTPTLARDPQNARFIFNDDTRQLDLLKEAVIGRTLDVPATIQAINTGLTAGQHQIALVFQTTDPAIRSDAKAADLGITELVVDAKTYTNGSSPERIQNIKTASAAFHGMLFAPGETISMTKILGDISLDKGYAEALIIYGDRTIKGVGGGVCQVSTTLFRAAFYAGYRLDERHPHAYRVSYYEQGANSPGPGLDATVFVPLVDFKFTNDTAYWLLMETYVYGNTLEWKFYSTKDGRSVTWNTTGATNVVNAPDPLYRENPDLPKGKIKQVDYQADGADILVTRTVSRDGAVLYTDRIKTHYLPWRAIYEFGPGTDLPKDAKTE
jgi:vancomycin resistance protein YoaR